MLDRDGVINEDSDDFIKSPAEWVPIPGSLEAIARLNQAGYRVVVATNQSGVARGLFDIKTLNAIHQKLHAAAHQAGAEQAVRPARSRQAVIEIGTRTPRTPAIRVGVQTATSVRPVYPVRMELAPR